MEIDTTGMPLTARKVVNMLLDGYWHGKEDLFACMPHRPGTTPTVHAIRSQIYAVRQALRPLGYIISNRISENKEGRKVVEWCLMRPTVMEEETSSSSENGSSSS